RLVRGEAAGRLFHPTEAEHFREAERTAKGVGLQFARDAIAPVGRDLVLGGPLTTGLSTANGVGGQHGRRTVQSAWNGAGSSSIWDRAVMPAFCSASSSFR